MPDIKTYTRFKKKGLCLSCGAKRAEGDRRFCATCRERHKGYGLKYYDKRHPKAKRRRQPRVMITA